MSLHSAGRTVEEIAKALSCDPRHVQMVLLSEDHPQPCHMYQVATMNEYSRAFSCVLRFKNLESARWSVARIDELWQQFAATNDRRGLHQCQLIALIGKNRAEGIGKAEEAKVFLDWLTAHLETPASSLPPTVTAATE